MGPVKPKNLPNYHSPLYIPSTHIKVNPVKRNSQKHINTSLSITLNPFKPSTKYQVQLTVESIILIKGNHLYQVVIISIILLITVVYSIREEKESQMNIAVIMQHQQTKINLLQISIIKIVVIHVQ